MDHNGNSLRIKIKIRNSNAAAKVDDNDCKKQFCSIDHMRSDSETPTERGLLFQPSTLVSAATQRSSPSPSPSPTCDLVDCSKFLSSWPLTGRRGRRTTSSTTTTDTVVDVIPSGRLNTKRVKAETHSDYERLSKIKVFVKENKNNGALEKEYKCNMCSKVFTSPRALGGHKSGHYKANKTDTAIKKETTSATIGTTFELKTTVVSTVDLSTDQTDPKRQLMDFDLNRLPLEEAILESCFLHL